MNPSRSKELEPTIKTTEINTYQPIYEDVVALEEAKAELRNTTPVTTRENIDQLGRDMEDVHDGRATILIAGKCNNSVDAHIPISVHVQESISLYETINTYGSLSGSPKRAIAVLRDARGQSGKPRSKPYEQLEDGTIVPTYAGDMVNGRNIADRNPDPSRMVSAAVQARDVEEGITEITGEHAYAAHEGLLLDYEESFIVEYEDGKKYDLSGDIIWIGDRTRHIYGPHVDLLKDIENVVGVKVSSNITEEEIRSLSDSLNPDGRPGKLIFMTRVGMSDIEKLPTIIKAIAEHAPGAVVVCDAVHGNIRMLPDGRKTRYLSDCIDETNITAEVCKEFGVVFAGRHIEAKGSNEDKECMDDRNDDPASLSKQWPDVDPNATLDQLKNYIIQTNEVTHA